MIIEFIRDFISNFAGEIIVGGVTSFTTYIFTKRRDNAETRVIEADAVSQMQLAYDKFVTDMRSSNEELSKEVGLLKTEVKGLRQTVRNLEQDLEDCRKGISTMVK